MTADLLPEQLEIEKDRSPSSSDQQFSNRDKERFDRYNAGGIPAFPGQKDNWDKLAAVAPIISGTLIFLMGGIFSYTFNQQQLRLQEIQTIEKFIPHLMGNEQSKKAAILAIKSLTNAELATKFASIFASSGTVSALQTMAENGSAHDKTVAETALADALHGLQERESKLSTLEKSYEEALAKTNGQNDASYLYSLGKLGDAYKINGRYAMAETILKKALAAKEKVYGPDNAQVADALRSLAELYQMSGKPSEAENCLKRAQSIESRFKYPAETDAPLREQTSDNQHEKAEGSEKSDSAGSGAAEARTSAPDDKKNRADDSL
jgi:tetratricopeptide (TPR) repeat protein